MDFSFTDEQRALRALCRDFAQREIAPHAGQWWAAETFPSEVFRALGKLGLMGMLIPEEYGGTDTGFVSYVLAMEEIGAADQSVAASWNAHSTIASLPLLHYGTEEQKQRWLVPLATGSHIGAFGLTEPAAGSDAAGIRTRARRRDGGWVLNGSKIFITNAGTDMSLGVTALAVTEGGGDSPKQFGAFFIPDGTPGYTKGPALEKLGWRSSDTRELSFSDCWVSDDHVIGDPHEGLRQFLAVLDGGRISVAALGLSLAATALQMAVDHVAEREQFGRPLSSFQALGHRLADMRMDVEAARLLTYHAAWLADSGQPFRTEAALAKLFSSEAANRVASASLQLHGGGGWMRDSAIARFYADAKILEIGEGTSEIQRNVIWREILRDRRPA